MVINIFDSHSYIHYYPKYTSGRIFHTSKDEYNSIEYSIEVSENDLILVENQTGSIKILENGMRNKEILKQYVNNENYCIL